MNTTERQYLNAILRQYNVKKSFLEDIGLEISCVYMNNKTYADLKAIGRFVSYTNGFQVTFCGHIVVIANLQDGIIDVGIDLAGLTY
jgi:hypothetical protein